MTTAYERAQRLAAEAQARGDMTGWLEPLYAQAGFDRTQVPWTDRDVPNPNLVDWLDRRDTHAGRALVVGCGLGYDAEELARRGYDVTAFDVAPTAVAWARRIHPETTVGYAVADLLDLPAAWRRAYDLVVEIYTVQVLRGAARQRALAVLPDLVAPGGTLLVVARARDEDDPEGELPWPLTRRELESVAGVEPVTFEDYLDRGEPPARRFRVAWRRPA